MPRVTYYVASSVDGFVAPADGSVDWLEQAHLAGEDYGYNAFYESVDALLFGRRTYAQVQSFGEWPYPGKPCLVLSRDEQPDEDPAVEFTTAQPEQVLEQLDRDGRTHIWLVGGANLAGSFLDRNLISDFVITVVPTLLGSGLPLLGQSGAARQLELVSEKCFENGAVQLHYRPRATR